MSNTVFLAAAPVDRHAPHSPRPADGAYTTASDGGALSPSPPSVSLIKPQPPSAEGHASPARSVRFAGETDHPSSSSTTFSPITAASVSVAQDLSSSASLLEGGSKRLSPTSQHGSAIDANRAQYLDTHHVYAIIDAALQSLLESRPADPYEALAASFTLQSRESGSRTP